MPIRILIADDHAITRAGVRATLESATDLQVVGEAGSGDQALALADELRPDMLLVDISMPGINGIDLIHQWTRRSRQRRGPVLSMHTERAFVMDAFRAGAGGYIVKTAPPEQLVAAVRAVAAGQSYIAPEVADVVLELATGQAAHHAPALTLRERQVLQLLAEGRNAKEAAAELGISDKTVHAFRAQVMRKLDLHSMADLTKYAIRHGITTL